MAVSPELARWALDPAIVHLNHGSFGACLRDVLATAAAIRARVEAAPMRYFVLDWQAELDHARGAIAAFVGASAARLAFVPNATTGVALALHAYAPRLAAGDELLTTAHAYRACRSQLDRLADARGLTIATVPIPLPFDADALVDAVARAITPRTRLALLDHVTSPTALRLPVERLVPLLAARGIATVVDGAHAPGQVPVDLAALGATYYVANCHKWLCAPKASGIFVAAADAPIAPLVTSHGATTGYGPANRLHAELDWTGTHDPAPYLAVPAALAAIDWPAARARNHALAQELGARLTDALPGRGVLVATAADTGAMVALPIALPAGCAPLALESELLRAGFEVPIVDAPGGPLVRLSAHLYTDAGDVDDLARVLAARGVTCR